MSAEYTQASSLLSDIFYKILQKRKLDGLVKLVHVAGLALAQREQRTFTTPDVMVECNTCQEDVTTSVPCSMTETSNGITTLF